MKFAQNATVLQTVHIINSPDPLVLQFTIGAAGDRMMRNCLRRQFCLSNDLDDFGSGEIMSKAKSPRSKAGRSAKTQARKSDQIELAAPARDLAHLPLELRIGAVIKRRRLAANLTLSDLSAGAGLSSAMLSRIENGMASASLDALERLCSAVGIGLSDLFRETEAKQGSAQLVKRAEQMEVVRVGTRYGHNYRLLSYDRGPTKVFEPFLIEMHKKSESYPRFSHPGTEFIYMLQGRMEYRFGEHTYLIEPGDAFTFSGDVVHGPENLLDDRITFLAIIFYGE